MAMEFIKKGLLDAYSAELFQNLYESVRDGWKEISHCFVSWFDSKIKCHGRQSLARNKFKSYSR